ncbi:MAG: hypothetical protein JWN78_3103 [Bacteroidota bacterium]|nr:hypothetical protein [Bacteroidota bacterium]
MTIEEIGAKIQLKQAQIQAESDQHRKQVLSKELHVLQLRKEIETIKQQISRLP